MKTYQMCVKCLSFVDHLSEITSGDKHKGYFCPKCGSSWEWI